MTQTVCVLAAGIGSRMGRYQNTTHKSLLPIRHQAALSHIILKFPQNFEFVIAVGYQSELVISYVKLAHPEHKIKFVSVQKFSGKGSGPGLSLQACEAELQKPFYLVTCDTLWSNEINWLATDNQNWISTGPVLKTEVAQYCRVQLEKNKVIQILDKTSEKPEHNLAYTGLTHIKDYSIFWAGLNSNELVNGEKQISLGFLQLLKESQIFNLALNWSDIGTEEKYLKECSQVSDFDFSKTDEFIYFTSQSVIKYFKDEQISKNRVLKAKLNQKVFPVVTDSEPHFYKYALIQSEVLYKNLSPEVFQNLLTWLTENLWISKSTTAAQKQKMAHEFYKVKTAQRLLQYKNQYSEFDQIQFVNSVKVQPIDQILKQIDLTEFDQCETYFIHGDLQPDNILYNKTTQEFLLLDWRQDFAGEIEFGDLYYDLAKLWAGLVLNYDQIKKNQFSYIENQNQCTLSFQSVDQIEHYLKVLTDFILQKKLSLKKVKILVGLIYLNMAPLHRAPFSCFLFQLARQSLTEAL